MSIIIFLAAIFAAFMVFVLLIILFATVKVIIRVVKGKLSPDNVHDVSVQMYILCDYVCYTLY